jgi:tRNA1(Val) A37 N6-methylase TrmN6
MNYLELAVKIVVAKPIYYTPKQAKKDIQETKFDFVIQNPPYDRNRIQGFNKVFKK